MTYNNRSASHKSRMDLQAVKIYHSTASVFPLFQIFVLQQVRVQVCWCPIIMTSRPILSWIVDAFNGLVKERIHLKQIRIVFSKFFRPLNVSLMVLLFLNFGEDPRVVPRQILLWISVVLLHDHSSPAVHLEDSFGPILNFLQPFDLDLLGYPLVLVHSLLRRNDRCFELPRVISSDFAGSQNRFKGFFSLY